jgi:putative restriction endonuclease
LADENLYRIVVAATDPDWYRFLRVRPELTQINFWRPGVASMNLAKGTPWLFLIRGMNEIWGCAVFAGFESMPISVTWDATGEANGFNDFAPFLTKIARLRGIPEHSVGRMGCAFLSNPEYFNSPIEYSRYGRMFGPLKSFDASTETGIQLRKEISARVQRHPEASAIIKGGVRNPVLVVPRLGQAMFRIELEKRIRCDAPSRESGRARFSMQRTSSPSVWLRNTTSRTDYFSGKTSTNSLTTDTLPLRRIGVSW